MWCLIDEIVCIPLCGNRDQARVGHSIEELVVRRVFGITPGYENLDYHNRLRLDPMLAIAVGKIDPTGSDSVLVSLATHIPPPLVGVVHPPIAVDNISNRSYCPLCNAEAKDVCYQCILLIRFCFML
ncbi:MAG: transposase [Candidatus Fermentibacteraceae bacterium]|nr:transposase [Candidatus Fermentibacteraceae bacterium]